MNDKEDYKTDQKMVSDVSSCCDGGDCCPSGPGPMGRNWKTVIFIFVLVAAAAVLARSFIGKHDADGGQSQQVFAPIQMDSISDVPSPQNDAAKTEIPLESNSQIETPVVGDEAEGQDMPGRVSPLAWGMELDSLASLNTVAVNTDAVFILLSTKDQQASQTVTKEIDAAVKRIKANGIRVSAFRLAEAAPEYAQFSKQVSIPCVLAMVKGGGMSAVSDEISEAKLVQAYVTASRPTSGCCPPGSTTCPPQ